jgi:hypothetical protein
MLLSKTAPDRDKVATLIHTAPPFGFLPTAELLANLVLAFTCNDDASLTLMAPP